METHFQLMGIIQQMQAEITKLEKENQALRKKVTTASQGAQGTEEESGDEKEEEGAKLGALGDASEQAPASHPYSVSTGSAPAIQGHQDDVMIIRRYSASLPFHSSAAKDPWKVGKRSVNDDVLESWEAVRSPACSSINNQDNEKKVFAAETMTSNSSSKTVSPEHGLGCRGKIKAVSFLLPANMSSHSENSSSLKYSPNQTTNELNTIAK
ncbi:putative coiled-coil domain-containing protein 195 [Erinaceus europaeus]|uniref:Coiled-coil domain-containing protein 195 n=1 Tax=Erinaceus europaeus TaxID=9365 RepID=A0ABM3XKP3_ERIEU|nr:putative coiled-coil domain-containing protein 195 [Erinaceus europaeus]